MDHLTAPRVEWGVAARAFEDGVSGDAHLVQALPAGALFGVVDGVGHGPAAAAAAREAIRLLAADPEHPVRAVGQCHERLKATRGVVLMLAWLESPGDCLWWIGVGNAQGVMLSGDPEKRARQQTLIGRVGVVGRQLPPLRATQVPIASGDVLVLTTDGIRTSFTLTVSRHDTPQHLADEILEQHWTRSDDGLVLVVRYQGAAP